MIGFGFVGMSCCGAPLGHPHDPSCEEDYEALVAEQEAHEAWEFDRLMIGDDPAMPRCAADVASEEA